MSSLEYDKLIQINDLLFDGVSDIIHDPEHYLSSHPEDVPDLFRKLCQALRETQRIVQEGLIHDNEEGLHV